MPYMDAMGIETIFLFHTLQIEELDLCCGKHIEATSVNTSSNVQTVQSSIYIPWESKYHKFNGLWKRPFFSRDL